MFTSRYFWLAIFLTGVLYPQWSEPKWWEDVLSIMPNVLGFSLGGYAMWMAIGDDDFRKLISGQSSEGVVSPYMSVNAAFIHFILLQLLSIIFALIAKAYYFKLPEDHFILTTFGDWFFLLVAAGYAIGYFVFIYAIVSAFAATLELLRVSSWYDDDQTSIIQMERAAVIAKMFINEARKNYKADPGATHDLEQYRQQNDLDKELFGIAIAQLIRKGIIDCVDKNYQNTEEVSEAISYRLTPKSDPNIH